MASGKPASVKGWSVAPKAVSQATALGFDGDVEGSLLAMFRHSTPFSHEQGNRRYERYMMFVTPGVIESVALIDVDPIAAAHRSRKRQRVK